MLARFAAAARFPVLSANIDASADPDLGGKLRAHVLLSRGALRVGVVGLTTLETVTSSSPGPLIRFTPPAAALAASAAALRRDGAHIVIALSHLGAGIDRVLAADVRGVDAYVGGHSHTLLSDSETGAAGPAHALIDRAVVVQAACFGRYLGRLDLDLDDTYAPVAYGGDCRRVGLDLPEDPEVAAIVAGYAVQLDGIRRRVVGHAEAAVDNGLCRVGECPLGNLVAEAMLASVHGGEVAIMNAGGLRTGLPGGEITLGDVLTMLPFGNTVATLKLAGRDLRAAIANGVGRAGGGGFPQIAGARVSWKPLAGSLTDLAIRQPDGSFAPLDADRIYSVVTNNFLRAGGDGYTALRDRAIDPYDTGPPLDEIVARALAAGPFVARTDGRITVR